MIMTKLSFGLAGLFLGIIAAGVTFAYLSSAKEMDVDMSTMGIDHQHPARPVSSDLPIPTVTHLMFPDAMDGYNVQILTRNFTFTPASINRTPAANEGHSHIYVNETKIARVYGVWYHLPANFFHSGENQVRVTLNANDHSTWTVEGDVIASTVSVVRP